MIVHYPKRYYEVAHELQPHFAHKISVLAYGGDFVRDGIVLKCEDCRKLLVEFLPASYSLDGHDAEQVRYEGHYDEVRDVCYVEVFRPGKAPYPLQERQDVINHSPTGISWGYGGSGPAQCALAILLDYLGDEETARSQYQHFKFRVIAGLPQNGKWTLTGRQIEQALKPRS